MGAAAPPPTAKAASAPSREERLQALDERWDQFTEEYRQARERGDEELMTNLRGLLLLIKREIGRLGGEQKEFPYPDEPHLADV
jgi:hypothetical protein